MSNVAEQQNDQFPKATDRIMSWEDYVKLKQNWSAAINSSDKYNLDKSYHLFYHLLRDGDLSKFMHKTTNPVKLANGHPTCGYDYPLSSLSQLFRGYHQTPNELITRLKWKFQFWDKLFGSVTPEHLVKIGQKYFAK